MVERPMRHIAIGPPVLSLKLKQSTSKARLIGPPEMPPADASVVPKKTIMDPHT